MTDKKRFLRVAEAVFRKSCGSLASGSAANCATPPVAGLEVDLWLINRADIDLTNTVITSGTRTITTLALNASTYAYKFTGLKKSNSTSIDMNQGTFKNNWIHLLNLVIFDNTSATKTDIIEVLADANLVAVVRNKWKGASQVHEFEVLGWDVGLEASAFQKKSDDAETQAAWKGTLSSPKDEFESNVGYLLYVTNQAGTLAALAALEEPGS